MGINKILRFISFVALCAFAAFSSFYDRIQRHADSLVEERNVTNEHAYVINKSLTSAVRVMSSFGGENNNDITSSSSGTYFVHNDISYVLTAAHSLVGECENTTIIAGDYAFQCLDVVSVDPFKDIGILQVENVFNRAPISVYDLLMHDEIEKNIPVHEKLIYTGFPQGLGPLTFDGKVISHEIVNSTFFAHSYAWAGSSGSGVFNSDGKLVGVITAVSVANSEYGVDVMEDLIIVTSVELIDFRNVL